MGRPPKRKWVINPLQREQFDTIKKAIVQYNNDGNKLNKKTEAQKRLPESAIPRIK